MATNYDKLLDLIRQGGMDYRWAGMFVKKLRDDENAFPVEDPETVLLIDSWRDQEALDAHHASPMMAVIASLREKYDLHMRMERFARAEDPAQDEKYIRK